MADKNMKPSGCHVGQDASLPTALDPKRQSIPLTNEPGQ
jgi:hypothetical protein